MPSQPEPLRDDLESAAGATLRHEDCPTVAMTLIAQLGRPQSNTLYDTHRSAWPSSVQHIGLLKRVAAISHTALITGRLLS